MHAVTIELYTLVRTSLYRDKCSQLAETGCCRLHVPMYLASYTYQAHCTNGLEMYIAIMVPSTVVIMNLRNVLAYMSLGMAGKKLNL